MDVLQLKRPIVFLDLETTGTNIRTDRIVEISVIKYNPDGTEIEKTKRVNPNIPIPALASEVHGIRDEDVSNEPVFHGYAKGFLDFLENCDIGGFNVLRFDIPLLQEEFKRSGLTWDLTDVNVIDPMVIFHKKEPRDLNAAYAKYCGAPLEGAHQALQDARAAKDILLGQIAYYEDIGETVEQLHAFCNARRSEWIDNKGHLINTQDGPAFGFGKHNGHLVSEVANKDIGYLEWILGEDFDPKVKEIITKTIKE
jgi:DNA polymerase-3 subunit epsilon